MGGKKCTAQGGLQRGKGVGGGRVREVEGMQERDGCARGGGGGGVKMEHRKAIKDGSVTRHWQQLRAQNREAQRLEEREKE